jgi:hypothetical protein
MKDLQKIQITLIKLLKVLKKRIQYKEIFIKQAVKVFLRVEKNFIYMKNQ